MNLASGLFCCFLQKVMLWCHQQEHIKPWKRVLMGKYYCLENLFTQTRREIFKNNNFHLELEKSVWKKKEIQPNYCCWHLFSVRSVIHYMNWTQAIFVLTVGHASHVAKSHPALLLLGTQLRLIRAAHLFLWFLLSLQISSGVLRNSLKSVLFQDSGGSWKLRTRENWIIYRGPGVLAVV
jgi:hypothetical protein